MISPAEWAQFAQDLSQFNDEVGKQAIIWKVPSVDIDRYQEGDPITYESRTLESVVHYNAFRVWPIGDATPAGDLDQQFCHLLLNNDYLASNGWLTANKNFDFNPLRDLFYVNGVEYRSAGDTPVSQDKSNPLYTIVILTRNTVSTGQEARP